MAEQCDVDVMVEIGPQARAGALEQRFDAGVAEITVQFTMECNGVGEPRHFSHCETVGERSGQRNAVFIDVTSIALLTIVPFPKAMLEDSSVFRRCARFVPATATGVRKESTEVRRRLYDGEWLSTVSIPEESKYMKRFRHCFGKFPMLVSVLTDRLDPIAYG